MVLALVFLLAWHLGTREPLVTLHLDHAQGLQEGDRVYLLGAQIGTVQRIDPYGHRVEIQLTIHRRHLAGVPADSRFVLYEDELDPRRRSIHVIPGESEHPIETRSGFFRKRATTHTP